MHTKDIHLLHAFLVFSGSRSIYEAAKKLGVSQPMLSIYLRDFEASLPQAVFQMRGRKKELTAYGKKLVMSFKGRFEGISEAIHAISLEYQTEEEAHLKVAGYRSLLSRVALRSKFKGRLEFISDTGGLAQDWLMQEQVDIAIASQIPDSHEIIAKKAFSDELVLVYPKKWSIQAESLTKATMALFAKHAFLTYDQDTSIIDRLADGVSIQASRIFSDWPVIFEMLQSGKGWTIAPDSYFSPDSNLAYLRLPKDIRNNTDFYILSRKSDAKIPWLKTMVQEIQEILSKPS